MDSTTLNKTLAALLLCFAVFELGGVLGRVLVRSDIPVKPAFVIAGPGTGAGALGSQTSAAVEPAPTAGGPDFAQLVAHADIRQGASVSAMQCGVCHSFQPNGAAIVGPALYDLVGRPIAANASYQYSPALKAIHGAWTIDSLNAWLTNPAKFAPGTIMGFIGIADPAPRAEVVAYLRSLSGTPAGNPGK